MGEWQPIATASKDGKDVLLYCADTEEQFVGFYRPREALYQYAMAHETRVLCRPTHWMPLPAAPALAKDAP
jgi:hypothetical protein